MSAVLHPLPTASSSGVAAFPPWLIARGVFYETLRRKDFYVLLIFMGLFALGTVVMRLVGVEDAATALFLLNLGMSAAATLAAILTLLTAARQIPNELEDRTIYPLLAKPVSRFEFIVGKWLAVIVTGIGVYLVLLPLGYLPVPKPPVVLSSLLLAQTVVLQCAALAMLASMGLMFSVWIPRALSIVVLLLTYFGGSKLVSFAKGQAAGGPFEKPVDILLAYFPDFSRLGIAQRFTDAATALAAGEFLALLVYAALFTFVSLLLALAGFRRQAL